MRRVVLLASGALLAGIALYASSGSGAPAASIPGGELDPHSGAQSVSTPSPEEVAAFQALAVPVATPEPKAAPQPLELELEHLELVGDHDEAPLRDGRRAVLTLDPDLQAQAEKLLAEARAPRGAIVAMAPDGRILALAGRRTEAPKGGAQGTSDWHLATDAWAPAASVFKLVTASALVAGGVDPDDKVCFHGGIRSVRESNLHDDKHDSMCQSLTLGVAHSNNAILGKLAYQHLEPSTLDQMAHALGLGGAAGVPGLDGPAQHVALGSLALPQQHDLTFAQAAAGFTGAHLSALGGAMLAATFADAGDQPAPHLIASIAGSPAASTAPHRVLPEVVARAVGKMMMATCDVGSAARSFGRRRATRVAGKTGTLTTSDPFYMEHSWFVGYAPADKPEIIVSVVLGNPENWHLRGHEAARRLIDRAIHRAEDRDPQVATRPARRAKLNR